MVSLSELFLVSVRYYCVVCFESTGFGKLWGRMYYNTTVYLGSCIQNICSSFHSRMKGTEAENEFKLRKEKTGNGVRNPIN